MLIYANYAVPYPGLQLLQADNLLYVHQKIEVKAFVIAVPEILCGTSFDEICCSNIM